MLDKMGHPMLHTKTLAIFVKLAETEIEEKVSCMQKETTKLIEELAVSCNKGRAPTKEEMDNAQHEEEAEMKADNALIIKEGDKESVSLDYEGKVVSHSRKGSRQ
jgi:hypothetical protein